MKQFYAHYKLWEDYQNGMYCIEKKQNEQELIKNGIDLLCDNNLFFDVCNQVLLAWQVSSKVNLTNKSCNRKAWLGQAACSFKYSIPETITRTIWGMLNNQQRQLADNVALRVINHFELSYENKNTKIQGL